MSGVVLKAAKFLLIAALMISIGAQWALLQSAAWVRMAVTYSLEEGSLAEGLKKTFDGKHACNLCEAVKEGKQSDEKSPALDSSKKKLEMLSLISRFALTPPVGIQLPRPGNETGLARALVPAHLPPRGVMA